MHASPRHAVAGPFAVVAPFALAAVLMVLPAAWGAAAESPPEKADAPAAVAPAAGAEISPEARAVLDRAMSAMGGEAALAKVRSVRARAKGTYKMGEMEMPYTSVLTFVAPDRILWKVESPPFSGSIGMSGGSSWSAMMAPPARAAGYLKQSLAEWPLHQGIYLVQPLLGLEGAKITVARARARAGAGAAKVEGGAEGKADREAESRASGEADGGAAAEAERTAERRAGKDAGTTRLRLELRDGRTFILAFAADGMLSAIRGPTTLMDGRKGRVDARLSKSRAFGDITLPSVLEGRTYVGEKVEEEMREETISIDWNPEVPGDAFAMPKLEADLMKPALKAAGETRGVSLVHVGAYDKLGETIDKLEAICMEAGIPPEGAAIAVYLDDPKSVADPARLRTEVVVPVLLMGPPPEKLPGGATMKTLPAADVVAVTARGRYGEADVQALALAYAWAGEKGHRPEGPPRIIYHHDPKATVPEDCVSEVQVPVKKRGE